MGLFLNPQSKNSSPSGPTRLSPWPGGTAMLGFDAPQLFSLPPGWAKAGIAMAAIIAAMTSATVTNKSIRFISTTLSVAGRRKKGVSPPLRLANELTLPSPEREAPPPFTVSLVLLGRCLGLRASENPLTPKFPEFPFYALW